MMRERKTAPKQSYNPASSVESGIHISENPSIFLRKKEQKQLPFTLYLLAFFGLFGSVYSFLSLFSFHFHPMTILPFTLICWLVGCILFSLPQKWLLLLIPILFGAEQYIFRYKERFIDGYMHVYNAIYSSTHQTEMLYYHEFLEKNEADSTTLFMMFGILMLSLGVCCFTVGHPNALLGFLFTMFLPEIGLYYGLAPNYAVFAMLLAYWVGLLTVSVTSSGSTLRRRERRLYAKASMKRRTSERCAILMMALTLTGFCLSYLVLSVSGFTRSDQLNTLRANIRQSIQEFSLDDAKHLFERIPSPFGEKITDHGNSRTLGNADQVSHSGQIMLTVRTPKPPRDAVYLKGYVGTVYDGGSWSQFSGNTYNSFNEAMQNLQKPEGVIYPQQFLNRLSFGTSETRLLELHAASSREPFNYVPYGADVNADCKLINDAYISYDNKQDYAFAYPDYAGFQHTQQLVEEAMRGENRNLYQQEEEAYRNFVYQNYLNLPDTNDMQTVFDTYESMLSYYAANSLTYANNEIETYHNLDALIEQVSMIKEMLDRTASYTLSPGATPKNTDFVKYFLLENPQGYCTYFATAGVVLCRMAGIPARYCEGYVLLSDDFKTQDEDGSYTVELPDNRAHAWCEIYLDTIGWVPYDFTPGASTSSLFQPLPEQTQPIVTTIAATTAATTTMTTTADSTSGKPKETQGGVTYSITRTTTMGEISAPTTHWSIPAAVRWTLCLLLLVACLICLTLLRRRHICKKRDQSMHTDNPDSNAIAAYQYLLQLLAYLQLPRENQLPLQYAVEVEAACPYLQEGTFQQATETALAADLQPQSVTAEDAATVTALAMALAAQILQDASLRKRFQLRILLCLIE